MLKNLKKWAFFYVSSDFSPDKNTVMNMNEAGTCTVVTIGFDPKDIKDNAIIGMAKKMKDEGVQMIELCGGLGPTWAVKISQALNYEIPIGSVTYGPEYRQKLLDIVK